MNKRKFLQKWVITCLRSKARIVVPQGVTVWDAIEKECGEKYDQSTHIYGPHSMKPDKPIPDEGENWDFVWPTDAPIEMRNGVPVDGPDSAMYMTKPTTDAHTNGEVAQAQVEKLLDATTDEDEEAFEVWMDDKEYPYTQREFRAAMWGIAHGRKTHRCCLSCDNWDNVYEGYCTLPDRECHSYDQWKSKNVTN